MNTKNNKQQKYISMITPVGKVAFPFVFKSKFNSLSGKEEYEITLIFKNKEDAKKIHQQVKQASLNKWRKIPQGFNSPLKDGNTLFNKDPEKYKMFKDTYFIKAKTPHHIEVVDRQNNEIFDETDFYAGCYSRILVTLSPYHQSGNIGVTLYLNAVQKIDEGKKISSHIGAEVFAQEECHDFEKFADDEYDDFSSSNSVDEFLFFPMKIQTTMIFHSNIFFYE